MLAAARNGLVPSTQAKSSENHAAVPGAMAISDGIYRNGSFTTPLPGGWSAGNTANGSSTFRIAAPSGMPEAHATLAVVAPASANPNAIGREQRSSLGGVAFSDLRRSVIDKMISSGGWVVNDRQRTLNGHRVFEVIAQTPASGDGKPEQVWNFYFTEIDGKVYSLTTHTAGSFAGKLTADAEKFLSTIPSTDANQKAPK
jgi:hypothetical protein